MDTKINKIVSGMVKDNWVTEDNQYTHALNAITEGAEGDRYSLTNEASNNLAALIPNEYKVIGVGREFSTNDLYFILTNPITGNSEVGKLRLKNREDGEKLEESECFDCGSLGIGERLEDKTQVPYLEYETLITDSCHVEPKLKFGFNINYRIKNIVFKREGTTLLMYLTDGYTSPYCIELSDINKYYTIEVPCEDNEITTCPDIEKMRIFRDAISPEIKVSGVTYGGTLPESNYQYFIRYCDIEGNNITEVLAYTEDIKLFNKSLVTRGTEENTDTNYAISLRVDNLDKRFTHYKLIVRVALNSTIQTGGYTFRTFVQGIYNTSRTEILHTTINNLEEVNELSEIYAGRRYVKTTDVLSTANKTLIHTGIKEQEIINLQPVVNLLGEFAGWRTYLTTETFYEDANNASNSVGYQRDEVVPFSISFETSSGYKTPLATLIGRQPEEFELEDVTVGVDIDKGVQSLSKSKDCSAGTRSQRWQFFNTAEETGGVCEDTDAEDIEYVEVEEILERSCTAENIDRILDGEILVSIDEDFYDFPTFLEELVSEGNEGTCTNRITGPSAGQLCEMLFHNYPPDEEQCKIEDIYSGLEIVGPVTSVADNRLNTESDYTTTKIESIFPIDYSSAVPVSLPVPLLSGVKKEDRDHIPVALNGILGTFNVAFTKYAQNGEFIGFPLAFMRQDEDQGYQCRGAIEAMKVVNVSETNRKVVTNNMRYFLNDFNGVKTEEQILAEMFTTKRHDLVSASGNKVHVIVTVSRRDNLEMGAEGVGLYREWMKNETGTDEEKNQGYGGCRITYNGVVVGEALPNDGSRYFDARALTNMVCSNVIPQIITAANPGVSMVNVVHEYAGMITYNGVVPPGELIIEDILPNNDLPGKKGLEISVAFYTEEELWNDKVTSFANWNKITPVLEEGETAFVLDVSPQSNSFIAAKEDYFARFYTKNEPLSKMKLSIFYDCSAEVAMFTKVVSWNQALSFKFEKEEVEEAGVINTYLVITDADDPENPIRILNGYNPKGYYLVLDTFLFRIGKGANGSKGYISFPTMGYYTVSYRPVEYNKLDVKFKELSIDQVINYQALVRFQQPILDKCKLVASKTGKFSYWESLRTYPDNEHLFDSSKLVVSEDKIPEQIKERFINKFGRVIEDGKVKLNDKTNFRCKPIRHFKFPDNIVAPFIGTKPTQPFAESIIEVLGITIDEEVINFLLDVAVESGLITKETRDTIIGYSIYRGDLKLERSVKSAGLTYDMRTYSDGVNTIKYPNYPYNSFEKDIFNNITENTFGSRGGMMTYHSPETDFTRETSGTELTVQGIQYGYSKGVFQEVEDHPKWVILSKRAFKQAQKLAEMEVAFELLMQTAMATAQMNIGFFAGVSSGTIIPAGVIPAVAMIAGAINQANSRKERFRLEWLQTYEKLGTPINFAYYHHSVGKYTWAENGEGPKSYRDIRALNTNKYIGQGRVNLNNPVTGKRNLINTKYREKTTVLDLGDYELTYPSRYQTYDKDYNASLYRLDKGAYSNKQNMSKEVTKSIASMYVYLKDYLPEQHGNLNNISWIFTGYVGDLTRPSQCTRIFGGDTYITRHSLKRKHAQFDVDYHKQSDMTPIDYSVYNNIGSKPKYYVKFKADATADKSDETTEFTYGLELDNSTTSGRYYVNPSKFYLYYYGIPYFLCESRYNLNFRTAKPAMRDQFYPEYSDVASWTQQSNLNISEDNTFHYNSALYNLDKVNLGREPLIENFDPSSDKNKTYKQGMIMYSNTDRDIFGSIDPWTIYRPNNVYFSNTDWGGLQGVVGVENEAILGLYDLKSVLFNSVDSTVDMGGTIIEKELGDGKMFSRRVRDFSTSIGGFGGTQGYHTISTEYGHFFVNNKAGEVYQLQGRELHTISNISAGGKPSNMFNWFKNHLPYKIYESGIRGIEELDVDNAYNGVGTTLGYDNRFKRLFITKKDYYPKKVGITYIHKEGFYNINSESIELTDTEYFEDVSVTISYNLKKQEWESFFSFKPNYYVTDREYFYTGINTEGVEKGLWVHNTTNKSYQVFYGKKYPFEIEFGTGRKLGYIKTIKDFNFDLSVYKYHNSRDRTIVEGMFDTAYVYGNDSCSGELKLVQANGSIGQLSKYPKTSKNKLTQEVLTSRNGETNYTVNYIYDRTNTKVINSPIWYNHRNGYSKKLNYSKVNFTPRSNVLSPLKAKSPIVRLEQNNETRLKYILDMVISKTDLEIE